MSNLAIIIFPVHLTTITNHNWNSSLVIPSLRQSNSVAYSTVQWEKNNMRKCTAPSSYFKNLYRYYYILFSFSCLWGPIRWLTRLRSLNAVWHWKPSQIKREKNQMNLHLFLQSCTSLNRKWKDFSIVKSTSSKGQIFYYEPRVWFVFFFFSIHLGYCFSFVLFLFFFF